MAGKQIYLSEKEIFALFNIIGTYTSISGVDAGVEEEYNRFETEIDKIRTKLRNSLHKTVSFD